MTRAIAIGIDPGSHYMGVAVADMSSGEPVPVDYITLEPGDGTTKDHKLKTGKRLKLLRKAVWKFLIRDLSAILGTTDWYLAFVSVEDPSSSTFTKKRMGKNGKQEFDNHKTQLVLGRSMQAAIDECERYADEFMQLNPGVVKEIPVLEVEPSDASKAVGVRVNASKLDRNIATAFYVGGRFEYPTNANGDPKPENGTCIGSALDGAGPDALDAYAALIAGWVQIKLARQEAEANKAQGQRSNVRRNQPSSSSKQRGVGRNRPATRGDSAPLVG